MSETVQYLREYLKSDPTHQAVEAGELVRRILIDAITADASDIHIEPWESSLCVRIRCNGVLQELVHLLFGDGAPGHAAPKVCHARAVLRWGTEHVQ